METNPDSQPEAEDAIPQNAFLIIEGLKVHPLTKPVINIGRRFENHIIIDDPRVSRQHAQLRAIHGHFVLFDLSSTSGTFVNGQRANQVVLYPGDVISLAGVTLIFSQNNPNLPDLVDTSPLGDAESKPHPTPAMDKSTVDVKVTDIQAQNSENTAQPSGSVDQKP